jgi:hypothetical protein
MKFDGLNDEVRGFYLTLMIGKALMGEYYIVIENV